MESAGTEIMYRISAPHFVAGIVFSGLVFPGPTAYKLASIISYMRGWSIQQVRDYCNNKRWTFEKLQ